jgi:hypothetical protein
MATLRAQLVLSITTLALAGLIAPSSARACVVGTGTGASCTEAMLSACLPGGGSFNGTVTFNCGGATTITITSAKTISAATTIDGGGAITISGGNTVAVFIVNSGVTFTVQNLTIANGNDVNYGSGIDNNGTTTATNCTFSGNTGGDGGAIYNGQSLSVTGCTFSGNTATILGGALYNDGTLSLATSTFTGNTAEGGGNGGALDNEFMADITGCTFSGNSTAAGGNGGGIYNNSTMTVTGSTFSGNTAAAGGNGGGVYNNSTLTASNCTFNGNTAAVNGDGGGLYDNSTLTIINCTVSGNTAGGSGGGVFENFTTITNTIVADNSGGNCSSPVTDGGHNIDDGTTCGFTGTGCVTTTGTSFCNTNPDLDPAGLADNGGPTETIALSGGSPAIDHGDPSVCAAPPVNGVDQRGIVRPEPPGGICDIGAFEVGATGTTTTTTTLPAGGCARATTFASIDCRLDELVATLQASQDLGRTKGALVRAATKARTKKQQAEGFAGTGKKKPEKNAARKAVRALASFLHRLHSHTAKKNVSPSTLQTLTDTATPILDDLKLLVSGIG